MLTETERAFLDHLYLVFYQTLLYQSYALLKSCPDAMAAAEECVQDTFLIAMKKIKKLIDHENPERWLMNTCYKATISRRRKLYNRARKLGFPEPFHTIEAPDPQNDIEEWFLREEIRDREEELKGLLTEQETNVFNEYFKKRLSIRETAQALRLPESSVCGTIHRIRKKCQKILV